ncbi:TetR/AcrR family transcriptional regulator [Dermatobacter hominis]|uniref:TetR/AcrR family transcriptional regulator n=1 Tax=Dermatobacter hominis TaxID=2884263 RepID=UPI001D12F938|nr:helix-turn-helix domain-containing protein [Dermatobacter hominis]UDY35363.1 TetR/AcrR family transcriptional regulator [Dermatobacter hominis]
MPSENVAASTDRRTRKREARRDHLLDLAAALVTEHGIEGLTMAALAEASDYATASLYTYFPSRSALLAALQTRALVTLGGVADAAVADWDARVAGAGLGPATGALARLWSFAELFLAAPDEHPHEFRLQQRLLVTDGGQDTDDVAAVVPAAMAVLDVPRRLLLEAASVGAIRAADPVVDPLDQPADAELVRTISWVVALNGALLTDGLVMGLPTTGTALGRELTAALLVGWGADPDASANARDAALAWRAEAGGAAS